MHLSESEWIAIAIFLVSIVKTIWDLWISNYIFEQCSKGINGSELTQVVKTKRKRDGLSGVYAFSAIAILTIFSIQEGAMTNELTREEFDSLNKRVKVIEEYFKSPDGGIPKLVTLTEELKSSVSVLQATSASQEDLDNVKRILSEIKRALPTKNKTLRAR